MSSRSWQGALTCGGACGCSGESSRLGAVEKATVEAEKHGDRSEKLAALVVEARGMIEKAKTEQAERARVAAEEAKAAAAVKAVAAAERARLGAAAEVVEAVKRQLLEERLAALALETQQVQAELGSGSGTSHSDAEETQCVVCFDAPKDHAIVPCGHICVCARCAEQLTNTRTPTCPVCREPIQQTVKVFAPSGSVTNKSSLSQRSFRRLTSQYRAHQRPLRLIHNTAKSNKKHRSVTGWALLDLARVQPEPGRLGAGA